MRSLNEKSTSRLPGDKPLIYPVLSGKLIKRSYDLVLSSAVFEHVRSRNTLDEIESYVSEQGSLAVHTLVRPGKAACDATQHRPPGGPGVIEQGVV